MTRRVVILEDDWSAREVLALRLNALACEPVFANDAAEVERAVEAAHVDLIICDLKICGDPFFGGRVVQELKSKAATAHIPIVIHSVFVTHPTDLDVALPAVDGYLTKPFSFLDLKSLIEALPAG